MARYKIIVEYDGTPYFGFQRQKNQMTVQQAIEEAISSWRPDPITIHVSGRTDTGVHALGQVIHVDIENVSPHKLLEATNHFLKIKDHPISFLSVEEVPESFHARFSSQRRHYVYKIINRRSPLTLDKYRAWHVHKPLDEKLMNQAAKLLIGHHDFSSFRSADCQAQSPFKTLEQLEVTRRGESLEIYTCSKSFLHHQVRNMAGALKFVGEGRWTLEDLQRALDAKDRTKGPFMAPACGLYFIKVDY